MICVSTTSPDKYIEVARTLIDKIKKEGFTADELKDQKTGYLTRTYYQQETNDAQANALASSEVIHGDWRRTLTIKDDVKKVTLDQLNKSFNQHISNINWSYQGDTSKVTSTYYLQKEIPVLKKKVF
jgi:zinc protease